MTREAVLEMERTMRLNEDVLRYMTVKVDALEEAPSAMMQRRDERGDRDRDRGDRGYGDRDRDRAPRRRDGEGDAPRSDGPRSDGPREAARAGGAE